MKKYLFGLIAVAFAVAFSAFSTKTTQVYRFIGANDSQLANPDNWQLGSGISCGDAGTVCQLTSDKLNIEDFKDLIRDEEPVDFEAAINMPGISAYAEKPAQ